MGSRTRGHWDTGDHQVVAESDSGIDMWEQAEEYERSRSQRVTESYRGKKDKDMDQGPERRWFYKDPSGQTQGPFPDQEMKWWYEEGFFDHSLPIACNIDPSRADDSAYTPLSNWFLAGKTAFLDYMPENISSEADGRKEDAEEPQEEEQVEEPTPVPQYYQTGPPRHETGRPVVTSHKDGRPTEAYWQQAQSRPLSSAPTQIQSKPSVPSKPVQQGPFLQTQPQVSHPQARTTHAPAPSHPTQGHASAPRSEFSSRSEVPQEPWKQFSQGASGSAPVDGSQSRPSFQGSGDFYPKTQERSLSDHQATTQRTQPSRHPEYFSEPSGPSHSDDRYRAQSESSTVASTADTYSFHRQTQPQGYLPQDTPGAYGQPIFPQIQAPPSDLIGEAGKPPSWAAPPPYLHPGYMYPRPPYPAQPAPFPTQGPGYSGYGQRHPLPSGKESVPSMGQYLPQMMKHPAPTIPSTLPTQSHPSSVPSVRYPPTGHTPSTGFPERDSEHWQGKKDGKTKGAPVIPKKPVEKPKTHPVTAPTTTTAPPAKRPSGPPQSQSQPSTQQAQPTTQLPPQPQPPLLQGPLQPLPQGTHWIPIPQIPDSFTSELQRQRLEIERQKEELARLREETKETRAEIQRRTDEEHRRRQEEENRKRQEEENRRRAEDEQRRRVEEEQRRRQEEQRRRAEEDQRRRQEEERRQLEEERRKIDEERRKIEEERRKIEEERKRHEEEQELLRRQEEQRRAAAAEEERRRREEEELQEKQRQREREQEQLREQMAEVLEAEARAQREAEEAAAAEQPVQHEEQAQEVEEQAPTDAHGAEQEESQHVEPEPEPEVKQTESTWAPEKPTEDSYSEAQAEHQEHQDQSHEEHHEEEETKAKKEKQPKGPAEVAPKFQKPKFKKMEMGEEDGAAEEAAWVGDGQQPTKEESASVKKPVWGVTAAPKVPFAALVAEAAKEQELEERRQQQQEILRQIHYQSQQQARATGGVLNWSSLSAQLAASAPPPVAQKPAQKPAVAQSKAAPVRPAVPAGPKLTAAQIVAGYGRPQPAAPPARATQVAPVKSAPKQVPAPKAPAVQAKPVPAKAAAPTPAPAPAQSESKAAGPRRIPGLSAPVKGKETKETKEAKEAKETKAKKGGGNEFGGPQMSPALEKWCQEHLQKLTGNSDLTLVHYCMTLNNNTQIREYILGTLGQTDRVEEFAKQFIQSKDLESGKGFQVVKSKQSKAAVAGKGAAGGKGAAASGKKTK